MDNGMQLCHDIDIGIRVDGEEYKLKCNLILENITVVKKFRVHAYVRSYSQWFISLTL